MIQRLSFNRKKSEKVRLGKSRELFFLTPIGNLIPFGFGLTVLLGNLKFIGSS